MTTDKTSKTTILLVDDEEGMLEITRMMLEQEGFEVIPAPDGQECLDRFDDDPERIDVVLLDWTLPRVDGATVFRRIKEARRDLKIFITSGVGEETIGKSIDLSECAGVIQKPFKISTLLEKIRAALDNPRD